MKNLFKINPGLLLFTALALALILANSPWGNAYAHFWEQVIAIRISDFTLSKTLHEWINDALMSIFFFNIGLEVKKEVTGGQFSDLKMAMLPVGAAIGGMIFPAVIFLFFNYNTPNMNAWAIPVATDIAVVLAVLAIFGKNIPSVAVAFMAMLAVIDDLGSTGIIALFYSHDIEWTNVLIALGFFLIMLVLNKMRVRDLWAYGAIGTLGLWFAIMLSGIHATVGAVLAAVAIPGRPEINKSRFVGRLRKLVNGYRKTKEIPGPYVSEKQENILEELDELSYKADTPVQKLHYLFTPVVNYMILPIFALCNGGIVIGEVSVLEMQSPFVLGIATGLFIGKMAGIFLVARLMVFFKIAQFPDGMNAKHLFAMSLFGGVGFTMSIFIAGLAVQDIHEISVAKTAVFFGSGLSVLFGVLYLKFLGKES